MDGVPMEAAVFWPMMANPTATGLGLSQDFRPLGTTSASGKARANEASWSGKEEEALRGLAKYSWPSDFFSADRLNKCKFYLSFTE